MAVEPMACPRSPGSRRIPAQLWDASLEARRLLDSAALEAEALVERAKEEAGSIRARAAAEGREEGLATATDVIARAALVRDRLLAIAEPQLVELAFAVARSILDRAVERDRGAVVELAARALDGVRQRRHVTLRTHPEDAAALREAEPRLGERLARARCLALVEDPAVGRGGVVVETEVGSVDARLDAQLEALRRALDRALEERAILAAGSAVQPGAEPDVVPGSAG